MIYSSKLQQSFNKIILTNKTGYEVQLEDGTTIEDSFSSEIDDFPSMKETIVYNEGDCRPYLDFDNSYSDSSGTLFINLYIE